MERLCKHPKLERSDFGRLLYLKSRVVVGLSDVQCTAYLLDKFFVGTGFEFVIVEQFIGNRKNGFVRPKTDFKILLGDFSITDFNTTDTR